MIIAQLRGLKFEFIVADKNSGQWYPVQQNGDKHQNLMLEVAKSLGYQEITDYINALRRKRRKIFEPWIKDLRK